MAMFFREHKSSFEESIRTIREVKNIGELGNVEVEEYGYDNRLNSETKIVLKNGVPIGFITDKNC